MLKSQCTAPRKIGMCPFLLPKGLESNAQKLRNLMATCFSDCSTRAWVNADTKTHVKVEVASSPRTLSASSTPPPAGHDHDAVSIYPGKEIDEELPSAKDGRQTCKDNNRVDDDDASSCLSSEVRLHSL